MDTDVSETDARAPDSAVPDRGRDKDEFPAAKITGGDWVEDEETKDNECCCCVNKDS